MLRVGRGAAVAAVALALLAGCGTSPGRQGAPVSARPSSTSTTATTAAVVVAVASEPVVASIVTTTTTEAHTAPSGGVWAHLARIRACESGGNYGAVSRSGTYRGAYQFSRATWDGNAARAGRSDLVGVDPAAASPADQDAMAYELYVRSGPGQWPHCSRV